MVRPPWLARRLSKAPPSTGPSVVGDRRVYTAVGSAARTQFSTQLDVETTRPTAPHAATQPPARNTRPVAAAMTSDSAMT